MDLARLNLPIAPGFVMDSYTSSKIQEIREDELRGEIQNAIGRMERETGKKFNDPSNPLLVKLVFSPQIRIATLRSIHHVGINDETVLGLAKFAGAKFAYEEYKYMLETAGQDLFGVSSEKIEEIRGRYSKNPKVDELKEIVAEYRALLGDRIPQDGYDQLIALMKRAMEKHYESPENKDIGLGLMVQAMCYGNYGEDSAAGSYYTRDIITGKRELSGTFYPNQFWGWGAEVGKAKDIKRIDEKYRGELERIARVMENHFREIRQINFTIEAGKLWLIEQFPVDAKSTQAHVRTLLDLNKEKVVDDSYVAIQIPPAELDNLLHSVIDPRSTKNLPKISGGIGGSTGAAIGRVFFSTPALIEEHKRASQRQEDTRLILVMNATFAEDVKAVEIAQGVLTTEGGYASHAPVVARSLGKTSLVNPEVKIDGNKFTIGRRTVKEGDYITLDVPPYAEPSIYIGQAKLIEPDFEANGLLEFLRIVEKFVDRDFNVRANADSERDAKLARQFGAVGIGLCRTEHMFFEAKRIDTFREMIMATTEEERRRALDKLMPMQRSDFYEMFKVMREYPVTIRLLDAPLHEFLPHTKESMDHMIKYFSVKSRGGLSADEVRARCDRLREFNPMLGHRGCRIAVSYPEIYEMQVRAIFEAACMIKRDEGIEVEPEIMLPVIMNTEELKFLKNGKTIEGKTVKGIKDIALEVEEKYKTGKIKYKVGTMIELPAAALLADRLAQYAEFFSFGTNDLTQTTNGISRDDINSFFPDYTKYDLLGDNPFRVLVEPVKELIYIATQRGRLTRPDLKVGLCGEHGADPANIEFCYETGLDYVSCSPYRVPLAKLAIAQMNIRRREEAGN
ncbi:MAG: putative PEP-binding protein [bacterium]